MLKPIETAYKGYKFRSHLEARWAVFFDTLGIRWEYEKQGYNLGGLWYLPDFWLPQQRYFIEIKGQQPTQAEVAKCQALAKACYKSRRMRKLSVGWEIEEDYVYMLVGDIPMPPDTPMNAIRYGYIPGFDAHKDETHTDSGLTWVECPQCGAIGLNAGRLLALPSPCQCAAEIFQQIIKLGLESPDSDRRWWWRRKLEREHLMNIRVDDSPRLIEAYTAARSARFDTR